jgi:hypothetical protein
VVDAGPHVFAILRGELGAAADDADDPSEAAGPVVLCLSNVSARDAECTFRADAVGSPGENTFRELITDDVFFPHWEKGRQGEFSVDLEPFEVMWLKLR